MSRLDASSFLLFFIVAFSAFSSVASSPVVVRSPKAQDPPQSTLSEYTCPLSNGSATLPAPQSLVLTAVGIGRGTQNYSCAPADIATTTNGAPKAVGAKAVLFDAAPFLADLTPDEGTALLALLPGLSLSFTVQDLLDSTLKVLGQHYFDAAGDPTFDLTQSNSGFLVASKDADIAAPPNSTAGAHGAVDWLALGSKEGTEGGLVRAYRTITAGGKAPASCVGQPEKIQIDYGAQYYFFSAGQ